MDTRQNTNIQENTVEIPIPGIDTAAGIKQCGDLSTSLELLSDVYAIIDKKCDEIENYLASGDLRNYTTTVHALKTTCRMLGHTALSESFFELEKAGKDGSFKKAEAMTPDVLARFRGLKPALTPYLPKVSDEKVALSPEEIVALLSRVESAAADFDAEAAETAIKKLLTCECDKELSDSIIKLSELVNDLEYDDAAGLAAAIKDTLL